MVGGLLENGNHALVLSARLCWISIECTCILFTCFLLAPAFCALLLVTIDHFDLAFDALHRLQHLYVL